MHNEHDGYPRGKSILEKQYRASLDRSRRRYYTEIQEYGFLGGINTPIETKTEFGYEITLSERDFLNLCDDICKLENLRQLERRIDEQYNRMLSDSRAEQRLREANPSLQKAYEKYKLMLDMVSGRQDGKSS